jgi:hypothetical protein
VTNAAKGAAPRKHHYVPQFYLRGFTGDNGQLLVTGRSNGKTFRTDPKNVAAQRDFNTVSIEGVDPQAVERDLAQFEGKVAPALERIKSAKSLATKEDRELLMHFIAGLAIRNPRQRSTLNDFMGDILQAVAETAFASKERWDSQVAQMKADGAWDDSTNVTFEDMQKFVRERNYKVKVGQEFNIGVEIEQHGNLLEHIAARKWRMLAAKPGTGGFVTTDVPVCLRWSDNADHGIFGPGFGVAGTQIFFPLSSELALIGSFEGAEDLAQADLFTVASVNANIISNAREQVYSRDANFNFMRPFPQQIGSGATLGQDQAFLMDGKPQDEKIVKLRTK